MNFRLLVFFIIIASSISCDFTSVSKSKKSQAIDTIVDFTRVDVSPAFVKCQKLMDDAKTNCFREEIHNRIASSLQQYPFVTEKGIREEVIINVLIDAKGNFKLKNITTSSNIDEQLPTLDSIIKNAITSLPKIQPAIKRGIPVATQYQLPIKVESN